MKPLFSLLLALSLSSVALAATDWQAGAHYDPITPAPPGGGDAPIEVVEFFMYGCPHCYQFEPLVKQWLQNKPEDVQFRQIPAMFGGSANLQAKTFYALEAMGELERLHQPMFEAIHEQDRRLKSQDDVEAFLRDQGVDITAFRAAFGSFSVQTKARRAEALMRRYGIRSVPAIVVDGRYRSGRALRSYGEVLEVTDYLIGKARTEHRSAQ